MEQSYDYTIIEKYIKKELAGAELRDFEQQLTKDKGLTEEVSFYQQVAEVATLTSLFEEADAELVTAEVKEKPQKIATTPVSTPKKPKMYTLTRRMLSRAASLIVLLLAGWWVVSTFLNTGVADYGALASENFVHYPPQEARGEELYKAYKDKNYAVAAVALSQYAQQEKDPTAQLYAAISYVGLKKPQEAIDLLTTLETIESLNNRKHYYLGLAHLQLGQQQAAIAAFEQMNNQTDGFLFKKAADLLVTLK